MSTAQSAAISTSQMSHEIACKPQGGGKGPRRESNPYKELFSIPGAKAFCLSGAVARLPMAMMGLGITLAFNALYGNWTIAGSMSAVYILAVAVAAPIYAKLFDRFGQHRIGGAALAVQVVAMLLFAVATMAGLPVLVLFVCAILTGLTQFSFGALVRTRWAYALRGPDDADLLNTAYAMEAAIDEVMFIVGPILAAFLATSVHPVSQLFVPAVACALGGSVFFSLKSTQPPVVSVVEVRMAAADDADVAGANSAEGTPVSQSRPARSTSHLLEIRGAGHAKPKSVLLCRGVVPLLIIFVVYNLSFSAFDVSVTSMMQAIGRQSLLGVQLSMFAIGSCVGGLVFGAHAPKGSNWRHMVTFLALLALGYLLIWLSIGHLALFALLSMVSGLCVSPVYAIGNLIVQGMVPVGQLTEGLSWVSTAGQVGSSLGSTLAGVVLDAAGFRVGLAVPCLTTVCTLVLALLGWAISHQR
ncbi:MFS transporter [Bifidobacterium sp. ESL0790]|uniref:MFS transporter n=1 Tax=Bifidobacterium sp. ESL0790 TaxID=2983233 RepID=UPI0023F8E580|nr:MFS transporter [Bifidobacterium sp. ESL0790]WEV72729.1 MFS transporter [Bifidobacterium sp. ESL0790]